MFLQIGTGGCAGESKTDAVISLVRNTARTFYAAGTFFDILNQFGDVSEDVSCSWNR
jgi:hypothetical protein